MYIQKRSCCRLGRLFISALLCIALISLGLAGLAETSKNAMESTILSNEALLALVTPEYISQTAAQIMDYAAPLPSESIANCYRAWKLNTFTPYEKSFRAMGATDEDRIMLGSRIGYAYEHQGEIGSGGKFQDYLPWSEVEDYVRGGENDNVLCDSDGKPILWMVNTTDEMKIALREAIAWYEANGAPDIGESLRNNGVCFMFATIHTSFLGPDSVAVTEYGGISPNMDSENIKMFKKGTGLRNAFIADLFWESPSINIHRLFRSLGLREYFSSLEELGYSEVVKPYVAGYASEGLFSANNGEIYENWVNGYPIKADDFKKLYNQKFGISFDDETILRLVETTSLVFDPIGFESLYEIEVFRKAFGN